MNPRPPATEDGSLDTDTLSPVWSAGWQWPWVVTLTVVLGGNFLLAAEQVYVGSFLLVGGLSLAVAGVRAVETESETVHTTGVGEIRRAAAERFGTDVDDTTAHTLTSGEESVVGIDRAKRRETTVLFAGAESVSVHAGAEVNLLATKWRLGDQWETFSAEQISDVEYSDGAVVVSLTDGTDRTYPSDRRPADALAAIETHCSTATST